SHRSIARRRPVLVFGVAAASIVVANARCSHLTELFVVVDSDLVPGSEIDHVRIEVKGALDAQRRDSPIGVGGLPATLGIQAGANEEDVVEVTASLAKGGGAVATTTVRAQFIPSESRILPISLCRSCLGHTCLPGLRCVSGTCVDEQIPATSMLP